MNTPADPGSVHGQGFALPDGFTESAAASGPKVVAFGGGTGMSRLLSGLKVYTENITAVVAVTDNGGSSGILRNEFDIVPPGDIRNCLVALANVDPLITKVLQYRFDEAEFKGHCFGNLFITVLARIVGDFNGSIAELNRLLGVKGRVLPAASTRVSLVADHGDGTKSTGEVQITKSGKRIERIQLRPTPVPLSSEIRTAIEEADMFLFGPGSLFTSVIPNLLIDGLSKAILSTGKPRVYISNLMTQRGETDEFALSDHVRALRRHVGGEFPDVVLAHVGALPDEVVSNYAAQGSVPVSVDVDDEVFRSTRVTQANLFGGGATAHHDPGLLAQAIHKVYLESTERESEGRGAAGGGGIAVRSVQAPESD